MIEMTKVHADSLPVEDRREGLLFSVHQPTRGPFRGLIQTGWEINPPPGIRAKVVEIIGNIAAGVRVQGPVLVYQGLTSVPLQVYVDSDVPLATKRPLFLLHFEEDFRPHVDRIH